MYGQTTSGKTYTMLGDVNCPGLLPYALHDLIEEFERVKSTSKISLNISYLEIYNEQINDLLDRNNSNLKVVDDKVHGSVVQNLGNYDINNFEEAMQLLRIGEENRQYKERQHHDHSSRSHTIFQLV